MEKTCVIGGFAGKFNIVHHGHLETILRAYDLCDELHVFVGEDKEYEATKIDPKGLKVANAFYRARWISEELNYLPNLFVHVIENDPVPGDYNDWKNTSMKMLEKIADRKPCFDKIFSGEKSYEKILSSLYPIAEIITIERDYKISSSKIFEEGIYKNWSSLPKPVRAYYSKKIYVIGPESTGKSTLVRKLSTVFNAGYTTESARKLWEEYGGKTENVYDVSDYLNFTYQRKADESSTIRQGNMINIFDTSSLTTYVWLANQGQWVHENVANENSEAVDRACRILKEMVDVDDEEYADLTILISPKKIPFVQDGTRLTEGQERLNAFNWLIKDREEKFLVLEGNYLENFEQAVAVIKSLIR
jgi:HTH-type transcriptional repressor of NAD biosynthesis genes